MATLQTILNQEIPKHGLPCILNASFYYKLEIGICVCYLSEANSEVPHIILPNSVGELVIREDNILGVLVGGNYMYFSVEACIKGVLHISKQKLMMQDVEYIELTNDGQKQKFLHTPTDSV